jgi:hypothetical protein
MTERSLFWDGAAGDGGPYSSSNVHDQFFRSVLNGTGDQGVLGGWLNELEVSGTTSPLTVATGAAIVYGLFYENDTATTVSIPTPSSGFSRYDRVVVRRDWPTQTARVGRVSGVAAASPSIPTLTQTVGSTYEVPLATILVDDAGAITVTDARDYCAFTTAWPANSADSEHFASGAVTADKIPDRTRYDIKEAGQLEADTTNPAAFVSGAPYDYWEFSDAATDIVWVYEIPSSDQVGTNLSIYLWSVPDVNGAGAGVEDVRWVYNYSIVAPEAVAGFTSNPVLVDQQLRVNTTVYRDLLVALATATTGYLLILSISREGGHVADTYASAMRLLGVELSWTADA